MLVLGKEGSGAAQQSPNNEVWLGLGARAGSPVPGRPRLGRGCQASGERTAGPGPSSLRSSARETPQRCAPWRRGRTWSGGPSLWEEGGKVENLSENQRTDSGCHCLLLYQPPDVTGTEVYFTDKVRLLLPFLWHFSPLFAL